jgi:hypothetical protein
MLEAMEKFERVFIRLGESDPRYMSYFIKVCSKRNKKKHKAPSLKDWGNARSLVMFLKIFCMVTLRFYSSLHITSNSFFNKLIYMHTNILQLCKSKDIFLGEWQRR